MRIVHICTGFKFASGITTFCFNVAREQVALGHEVTVLYLRTCGPKASNGVRIMRVKSIGDAGFIPDLVQIHGLWSMLSVNTMRWCRRHRVPYVVSPHGGLMPRVFTKGRLKKWLAWNFLLKHNVQHALLIHCTATSERDACVALGLRSPCVVAPLGCNIPTFDRHEMGASESRRRTVLFLGRLDEEKGLPLLLEAWDGVDHKNWTLKLAGPDWGGYKSVLDRQIAESRITGIEFPGSADEALKDVLYREADLFVLSSPMENFSMVVLDALAYGVPVIATKGTPWSILETAQCGWWVGQGVEPLRRALAEAMRLTDGERRAMGERGVAVAKAQFQWRTIVGDFDREILSRMHA